ncbi:N-acyl-L-amino acid amidohydrolase [Sporocytophaga myxococcoides]|uniref:N-acyl-L-amino acid amidohydrolase n=1 Tax=Sporocytophaga myxococcoides TaxID=153721 RepID=A0A098LFG9_9BACT|nr:M20 family metallopeptidase [Sporocytophaga myxococcoides]GAL84773.1 N-acyl-L-amino acid amidohydrolase [Sporocytophaga myxococcoides]
MSSLVPRIKELAAMYAGDTINDRRYLHANPELSFEEFNTCKYVAEKLRSFGIETQEGVADTGVVGLIKGRNPEKKIIALRADMDALPIVEANEVPYKSKNVGVMHACGHDVHTSSLLGSARILQEVRDSFEGTIKLVFQPGEEKIPGGASLMIKAGVLQNPAPVNIIGQHVMPSIPAGKVGFRSGMYMASADEIYVTVKGKGGHAAMPDKNIDPILIASHIIIALQQIVSRNCDPKLPCVLSFGKFIANGATNVVPNEVKIEGTFRTLDEKWRKDAHTKMKKMAECIAEGMGGECEFTVLNGYPYLRNEPELTGRLKSFATDFLGEENVVDLDLWMASEDFAYYTQQIDACFYRLGVRNEAKGIISGVHTPTFDIEESALETGSGLMAWLAVNELGS